MTDMTIATTILAQLGGPGFRMMTGSKDFVGGADSLSFKIGSGAKGPKGRVSHCRIVYNAGKDLYTMTFMRFRNTDMTVTATHSDVYMDQLRPIFSDETGFVLTVPRLVNNSL